MSGNVSLYGIGASGVSLGAAGCIPIQENRAPASTDIQGPFGPYVLGQIWIDTSASVPHILVAIGASQGLVSATWKTITVS